MSSHFTVVYDACVLYPAPLRDLLMHLALSDLYRARWSDMLHDEWTRNVLASRPDLTQEQLNRTRQLMNAHVRDSLVTGFEYLIPSIKLPDPDDRHVVAAAIHSGASLIVTFNLKDFPFDALKPCNLAAQHPDDFIVDLLDLHPAPASASATRSPPANAKGCGWAAYHPWATTSRTACWSSTKPRLRWCGASSRRC
ncbi:PIN domain-containing protein [Comamonas sp. NLF-1-9]|uniref:PIN domain-containing protein n=1 Tax=Comamonas sp. NLF-1-9 TaxID=2853163 RepID=UPI002103B6FC|nr:PIN domain-containing protein [Comamonas sp. NLF-1-9]